MEKMEFEPGKRGNEIKTKCLVLILHDIQSNFFTSYTWTAIRAVVKRWGCGFSPATRNMKIEEKQNQKTPLAV